MAETHLLLCADDYGLSPGIGRAIRDLAARGAIGATSCLTPAADWPAEAARLRPLDGRIQVGLHLCLTELAPIGPMPRLAPGARLPDLAPLLLRALAGGLRPAAVQAEIRAEWLRQYAAFVADFGRTPDFIDGHQHVHVFPGARRVLLDLVSRWAADRPAGTRPLWVRSCEARPAALLRQAIAPARALLIAALSAGLGRALARRGIATNAEFRGVRSFAETAPYAALLARFLAPPLPAEGWRLVMCHPGSADPPGGPPDPILAARVEEYRTLWDGTQGPPQR